ncbi:MAG: uroporphyrinogen decarboxylase family protein [Candidatus Ratteibacteria bacterium]
MTRRERLIATFQGKQVDRPAVSFYEIGGWEMAKDEDEFNVWNDPSWRPLVRMALAETDILRSVNPTWKDLSGDPMKELINIQTEQKGNSFYVTTTLAAPGRTLKSVCRRDKDTQTSWVIEHLLKNREDAEAWLRLPDPQIGIPDVSGILAEEEKLGDSGIVNLEAADPLCEVASLFPMDEYTVLALTDSLFFHQMLEKAAGPIFSKVEQVAKLLPGRLWRICGSEYASEPYLPPRLYKEYVVKYTGRLVEIIQKYGGYARIHSHGRLKGIISMIADMNPDALDPLEPPPQGDITLREIREEIGEDIVLMGNIEAADIENLDPKDFEKKVLTALDEGPGEGSRGFILLPSACPYGRTITPRTMANYETMIRCVKNYAG